MKILSSRFIPAVILILLNFNSSAQDIIIKNDKTEIKAKIIEIQETVIKYKMAEFIDGPLRNIPVSEVFMIIYENGKRETFSASVQKTAPNQPIAVPDNWSVKDYSSDKNPGFVFGGEVNYFIPYNQSLSEIYGSGFMFGCVFGYWWNRSGLELKLKRYDKKGQPYEIGAVDESSARFTEIPITLTAYWVPYRHSNFNTYVGGGLGACRVIEKLTITSQGQSNSAEANFMAFELHSTGGIKFNPFYFEVTFSSIVSGDYEDVDFGGIILGFGLSF